MSSDSILQQAILAEFSWEPRVNAGHIGVTAKAGVVTLSGHVASYATKHAAENAARRVKGVKAVAEEIEVRLPFETRRSDADIAEAALNRLTWNVSVPVDSMQIKVEKGWVTLTGQVEWAFQREAAGHDMWPLMGVVGVSNEMTIRPRVDTVGLSDAIIHALHRTWFYNSGEVHVRADGGHVVLSGTVHSFHERQVAADTAWAAPGATSVENGISVV